FCFGTQTLFLQTLSFSFSLKSAFDNWRKQNALQTLKEENEALWKMFFFYNLFQDDPCPKCEEDWEHHRGKCYYFSTHKLTWEKSRNKCRDKGGDLVKIDGRNEQRRLREVMIDDADKFWIGLTDSEEEGQWLWVDGSPLDESFWGHYQPDNWIWEDLKGEDCVRMGEKDGAPDLNCWFDKSCQVPHRSICEKPEKNHQNVSECV
uniref:C-type lectin domain-containing protein n=1 Tax=Amphiprion ocellaris TaxID=80972 RepID=A0AAQ5ZR40_AMPOC